MRPLDLPRPQAQNSSTDTSCPWLRLRLQGSFADGIARTVAVTEKRAGLLMLFCWNSTSEPPFHVPTEKSRKGLASSEQVNSRSNLPKIRDVVAPDLQPGNERKKSLRGVSQLRRAPSGARFFGVLVSWNWNVMERNCG